MIFPEKFDKLPDYKQRFLVEIRECFNRLEKLSILLESANELNFELDSDFETLKMQQICMIEYCKVLVSRFCEFGKFH